MSGKNENMIPNRSMFDIWRPNQSEGVPVVKNGGLKGGTRPYWLTLTEECTKGRHTSLLTDSDRRVH